jgi:hypothetical protein
MASGEERTFLWTPQGIQASLHFIEVTDMDLFSLPYVRCAAEFLLRSNEEAR